VSEEIKRAEQFSQGTLDQMVESLYHEAVTAPATFSSEGGLPVEDRWWNAIERAYRYGHSDTLDGLHGAQHIQGIEAVKILLLRPTDHIVLKTANHLTHEARERLRDYATQLFKHPVVVLDGGVDVEILRKE
jgi:hypothetical protein